MRLIKIMGGTVALIGALTVLGYIFDARWLATWAGSVPMAFNTGISFLLLGLAVVMIALEIDHRSFYRTIFGR